MERDSFLFYRSFYEAIKGLPKDIQVEIYTAIMEYALYGNLSEEMKPFAKSVFTLIKPVLDTNLQRYENGKKGGSKKRVKKQPETSEQSYTLAYEQEIEKMKNDEKWRKTICEDFKLTTEEYNKRLSRFLDRCNDDKARKGKEHHDSYVDCQSHLRYWMTKAYPGKHVQQTLTSSSEFTKENITPTPPTDYTFDGGFGGMDT